MSGDLTTFAGFPFKLKLAGNEILQAECPRWRTDRLLLRDAAGVRSRCLAHGDRAAMVTALLRGSTRPEEHDRTRLLKSASGRWRSVVEPIDRFRGGLTVS